jgi:hypothetical protein
MTAFSCMARVKACVAEIEVETARFHLDPGQLHMFVKSSTIKDETRNETERFCLFSPPGARGRGPNHDSVFNSLSEARLKLRYVHCTQLDSSTSGTMN